MLNHQGNQDFVPIDRLVSESGTSHLPQIVEPVSVQKFLDRIMQYQVDPAQVGRQICQIIATNSDREMLLHIAKTLGVAFQSDYCSIAAVTDKKVAIPNACWQNRSDRPNSSDIVADLTQIPEFSQTTILNLPLISPVLARVLADGEVAGISDIQDCPVANVPNSLMAPLPFRAILVAPVRFGAAINGIIMLGKSQPYEWSAADRQQLEGVSDSIAIAFSQIQKTQEITTLNQHLQQQAQYQNLLRTVASSIDTSSEIEEILQRIIENTVHTLAVDRGKILLLRYTDPLFQTRSAHQTPKAKVELVCQTPLRRRSTDKTRNQFWILSESSLCNRAFNNAPQSLALVDTGEFIREEHPTVAEILNLIGTRSLLMVPLLGASGQGTVLGFLVLQHSEPRTWGLEELEVVESVAAQVTTAIIQTQTLKQIQALVEDRTSQLQRSLDMQATLYKQTLRQVEQLRRLNQLNDEFVATMSDALRNPLTAMTMAIQMLKTAQLTPRHQSYLEILETECIRETALINDLLALRELEARQTSFPVATINLDSLINNAVDEFERQLADNPRLADKKLTWRVDVPQPSPLLETHSESLKRILLELLTNAGTFSVAGTAVVLEVSQTAGYIVLSVSNFGRGISAEDLPHIFENFRRGTGVTEQGIVGTGLGLALVKSLVQHLNGTIDVSSSPLDSSEADDLWRTCFTLTLPQFPEEIFNLEV